MRPLFRFFLLWLTALTFSVYGYAQQQTDSIMLGGIIVGQDTLPMVFLPDHYVKDRLPQKWVKKVQTYNRLKYNVYKVYPYAVIAAEVLRDYDAKMEQLPDKKSRKEYKKKAEQELKKRFKGELTDMTISQGQVLVKLINRQTGRDCYSILKEVKGGFNAVVYQSVAVLFSNSLKRDYDPTGDDQDMEAIVRELEATNYYRYQYQRQQQAKASTN